MEAFEQFYPSEVARLVLGYLNEINCLFAWEIFLVECTDLQEHYKHYNKGKRHSTNVNGKSLLEILNEYCSVKYKVPAEENCSSNEKHTIQNEDLEEKNAEKENSGVSKVLPSASSLGDGASSLQFTKQDTLTSTHQSISHEEKLDKESVELAEPALHSYNSKKISANGGVKKFSNATTTPSTRNPISATLPFKRPAFSPKCNRRKPLKILKCCKKIQTDNLSLGDKNIQTELMFKNFLQSVSATSTFNKQKECIPNSVSIEITEQDSCVFNKQVSGSFVIMKENVPASPLKKRKGFIPKKLLTDSVVQWRVEKQKQTNIRELFEDMIILEKLLSSHPLVKSICDTINQAISEEQAVVLSKDDSLMQSFICSEKVIKNVMIKKESDLLLQAYMPLYNCRKDFIIGKLRQKPSTGYTNNETITAVQSGNFLRQDVLSTDVPLVNCAVVEFKQSVNFESESYTSNKIHPPTDVLFESNTKKNMPNLVPNNDSTETCAFVEVLNLKDSPRSPLNEVNSNSDAMEVDNVPSTVLDYSEDAMSITGTKSLSPKENNVLQASTVASKNSESIEPIPNIVSIENNAPIGNNPTKNIMTVGSIVPVSTHNQMISSMENVVLMDSKVPLDNFTPIENNIEEKLKSVPIGVPFKSEMLPHANQLLKASNLIPESIFIPTNQNATVNNLIMNNGDNISNLTFPAFPTNNGIFSASQVPYSGLPTFFIPNTANAFPMQNNVQYSLIINPNINWNCNTSSDNNPFQSVPFDSNLEIQQDGSNSVDFISKETSSCILVDQPLEDESGNVATIEKIAPKKSIKSRKSSASLKPKIKLIKAKELCMKKNLHIVKSPVESGNQNIILDSALKNKKLRRLLPSPSIGKNASSEENKAIHLASIDSYVQEFCNESLKNFAETEELSTQIEIDSTQNPPLPDLSDNLLENKQEKHSFGASLLNVPTEENESCAAHDNIDVESSYNGGTELSLSLEPNVTTFQSSHQNATTKSKAKKGHDTVKKIVDENKVAHPCPTSGISNIKVTKKAFTKSKQKKAKEIDHVSSGHNLNPVDTISAMNLESCAEHGNIKIVSSQHVDTELYLNLESNATICQTLSKTFPNQKTPSRSKSKSKKTKASCDSVKKIVNTKDVVHQSPTKEISSIKAIKKKITKSKQKKDKENDLIISGHNLKPVSEDSTTNLESSTLHKNIKIESSQPTDTELSLNLDSNATVCQSLKKSFSNQKATSKSKSKSKKAKVSCDTEKKMTNFNKVVHQSPNKVISTIKVTKKAPTKSKQTKAKMDCLSSPNLMQVETISITDSVYLQNVSTTTSMADEVLNAMQKAIDMKPLVTLEGSKKEISSMNSEIFGSSNETLNLTPNEISDFQKTKNSASMQAECNTLKSICISEAEYFEKSDISSSNSGLGCDILAPETCDSTASNNNLCKTKTCLLKNKDNFKPKVSSLESLNSNDSPLNQNKEINSAEKVVKVSKRKAQISKTKSKQPSNKKTKVMECSEDSHLVTLGIQKFSPQTQSPTSTKLSSVKKNYKKSVSPRYQLRTNAYKRSRSNESKPNVLGLAKKAGKRIKTQKVNSSKIFENSFTKQISLEPPVSPSIITAPSINNENENSHSESLLNKTEQILSSQELFVEESYQTSTPKKTESTNVFKPISSVENSLKEDKSSCKQLYSDSDVDFQPLLKKAIVVLEKLDEKTLTEAMYPKRAENVNVEQVKPSLCNENSQVDSLCKEVNNQNTPDHSNTLADSQRMDTLFSDTLPEEKLANVAIEAKHETKLGSSLKHLTNDLLPKSPSKYEIAESSLSTFPVENVVDNKITKDKPEKILSCSLEKSSNTNLPQSPLKCDVVSSTLKNTMNDILPSQQLVLTDSLTKVSENYTALLERLAQTQTAEMKRNKTIEISKKSLNEKQSNFSGESIVSKEHIKSQPSRSPVVWKKRKLFNAFNASKQLEIDAQCGSNNLKSKSSPDLIASPVSNPLKSILKKNHKRNFSAPSSVTDFDKKEHVPKKTMISRPTLKIVGFKTPPKEKKPARLPSSEVPNWNQKKMASSYSSSHVAAQIDSSLLGPKLITNVQPRLKSHQRLSQFAKENKNTYAKNLPTNSKESGMDLDAGKGSNELLILPSQDKISHIKSNHDDKVLTTDATVLKNDNLPQTMITNTCKSSKSRVEDVKLEKSSDILKHDSEKNEHIKKLPHPDVEKFVTENEKKAGSHLRKNSKPICKKERNLSISKYKKTTASKELSPLENEVIVLCTKENKLPKQSSSLNSTTATKDFSKSSQSSVDENSDSICSEIVDKKSDPKDSSLQSSSHEDKELVNTSNESQSEGASKNDIIIDLTLPECNSEEFLTALSAEMAKSITGVNEEDLKEQIREYGFENLMNLLIKKE